MLSEVAARRNAEFRHLARSGRSNAVELADGQAFHERGAHARGDDEQSVRFAVIGRQLGEELVVGHARGGRQTGFRLDAGSDLPRDRGGGPTVFQARGDVQVGFVQ